MPSQAEVLPMVFKAYTSPDFFSDWMGPCAELSEKSEWIPGWCQKRAIDFGVECLTRQQFRASSEGL